MMMGKDAVARNVRPGGFGTDPNAELDGRKRRILRRGTIAASMTPGSQQALADAGKVARVNKGKPLFAQGEAANHIAVLSLGRVRLSRSLGEGREFLLGYRAAGDVVGEVALGGPQHHPEEATALEDLEALLIPVQTTLNVMSTDPGFSSAILATLADRQTDLEERLASLLFRNVEGRLAEFLVKAAARWGIPDPRGVLIAAPLTHQEMANMIGSTRETVTLTLGDFKRKGIIDFDRRRVVVADVEALKSRF